MREGSDRLSGQSVPQALVNAAHPVNALLSFAYALLLKDCFSALCTVGFDPYCGFYHVGRHGKPSLALDLMEEFRAIIADSVVLTLINNGALDPSGLVRPRSRLYDITDLKQDQVLFVPICPRCAESIDALGRPVEAHDVHDVVIVT